MTYKLKSAGVSVALGVAMFSSAAMADFIDPLTFTDDTLAVGESITVETSVVIESTGTTSALIDTFFLVDTSGSMGSEIAAAQAAAADLLTGLSAFGDVQSGVGVFAERALLGDAIRSDLADDATTLLAIDDVRLGDPDFGGSFPESSNTAIDLVANNASWRPGSNRFIFAFGDATSNDFVSDADVIDSLEANNVTLVGLNFGEFDTAITDLGGTVFDGGTTPADIIDAVTAGIVAGFADYSIVGLDDLGGGGVIDVSVACVDASTGACNGAVAEGDFDRSTDNTFTFEVTYTRTGGGTSVFDMFGIVDGGIVTTQLNTFTDAGTPPVGVVPLPAAGWMLIAAFGGLGLMRRRQKA